MVPATLTVTNLFGSASTVVDKFADAVLLVAGIGLGVWGVRFVIGLVRRARS